MYRYVIFFFFFKQKTAYEMRISDWSSDVCSSDLATAQESYVFIAIRPRCAHVANHLGITVHDETGVEVFRCAAAQQHARGLEDPHRWPVGLVARPAVLEAALAAADAAAVPVDPRAVGADHGLAAARAPRPIDRTAC